MNCIGVIKYEVPATGVKVSIKTAPLAALLSQNLIVGVELAAVTKKPVKTPTPKTTWPDAVIVGVDLDGLLSMFIIVLCLVA